jgi:hypothetical protein
MKTIWKFGLKVTDTQDVVMPTGAKILDLQVVDGRPYIWAIVRPDASGTEWCRFHTYGTGHVLPDEPGDYIGTYQTPNNFVYHVFQVPGAR